MSRDTNGAHPEETIDSATELEASSAADADRECSCGLGDLENRRRVSLGPLQPTCAQCATLRHASREAPNGTKGKRKAQEMGNRGGPPSTMKRGLRNYSGPRTRLTLSQKMEVLQLIKDRVRYQEIEKKYNICTRTVSYISSSRKALEMKAKSTAYNSAAKSSLLGTFPKIEDAVVVKIEEARRHHLSVTQKLIRLFARSVKDDMLAGHNISEAERSKLEGFTASKGWVRKFAKRKGLNSNALHGEVLCVDDEAVRQDRSS